MVWDLILKSENSSYEPHKWLYFMLHQVHMSKNGFSRVPNRFLKNFSDNVGRCFGTEIKCFVSKEHFRTFLWSFPGILKQFERIEKNHHFSFFWASESSILWRIWPFLSTKKVENFFFKINEINRKSAPQTF